jgi:hypothetical protein
MDEPNKEVRFDKYCHKCQHYDENNEYKDPCEECLDHPLNLHTEKPFNYEERR